MQTKSVSEKNNAPLSKKPAEKPLLGRDNVTRLQRAVGNQAFGRLLMRDAASAPSAGPLFIQPKLSVGATDDPLERAADDAADRVLRMPAGGKCSSCECPSCQKEDDEGTHEKLVRKEASVPAGHAEAPAPSIVHDTLREPGQPLDRDTRSFFEPRFGFDFSNVRLHTGALAAESASAVDALAFTVGHHIVFGQNQFSPGTSSGSRLLAHELAHVTQQGNSVRRAPAPGRDRQVACVVRLGGCVQSRDAGVPSPEEIEGYNRECRRDSKYSGPDLTPSDSECANPPKEPLSTGEKILLGAFVLAGAAAAIVLVVAAAEIIVPVVIATISETATAGLAFYFANAIVVNDIGLFAAGVLFSCEGNLKGLLQAISDDPLQAAPLLVEVYILHMQIKVANQPARNASVPVKLLPQEEQTEAGKIRFKSVGPPVFEEVEGAAQPPKSAAPSSPGPVRPATLPAPAPENPFDTLKKDIRNYRTNPKTPPRIDVPATPRVPGDPKAPNVPVEGGTVAVARTNVAPLANKPFGGASPEALPEGLRGKPGTTGGTELKPVNPIAKDHAENVALNNLHQSLSEILKDATPEQRAALLRGKTVWLLVEQEPCSSCAAESSPGILKQFSSLYPELRLEVRNLRTSGRIEIGGGIEPSKKP